MRDSPETSIRISNKGDQLAAEEMWTSKQMKTDFTELIAHKGYLYGIDGSMFSCVDLKTGVRVWKDGRYGKGEAVLIDSADQILISAEDVTSPCCKPIPRLIRRSRPSKLSKARLGIIRWSSATSCFCAMDPKRPVTHCRCPALPNATTLPRTSSSRLGDAWAIRG